MLVFSKFIQLLFSNPFFFITVLLTMGVIFVNGWTDAPNAIATCVATRCLKPKKAVMMSAVFNFLGVLVMTLINSKVAMTIKNMVDFGNNVFEAQTALCAALFAIILWATLAWIFGIPTSESHALIAGLSGAAIALHNGFTGIHSHEWIKVIYGLIFSSLLGFAAGLFFAKLTEFFFCNANRCKTSAFFKKAQIFGGAAMSFMHGAQDGQKFMGVFILVIALTNGNTDFGSATPPFWMMLLCSLLMSVGTSLGGYKIIKSVGMDMVKLEPYQGFSADIAGAFCLLMSSLFGIPVSTTHTKTTAIMGVGATKRLSAIDFGVVKNMVLTWFLTFPGCGLIGFVLAKIFMIIF